jgi:uncharacterized protein (DUF1800 family)
MAVGRGGAAEANPLPPRITLDRTTKGQLRLIFPYPGAQQYQLFSTGGGSVPLAPDMASGTLLGPAFLVTNNAPARFYRVNVTPLSSNDLLAATVLNRLCYGPSPDDLEHIRAVGPDAFIREQMAGESIPDTLNSDPPVTNVPLPITPPTPLTNWMRVSATGASGGTSFGAYLSGAGSVYLDNLWLVAGTNAESGTNLLVNGDFEDPLLSSSWVLGSAIGQAVVTNSPTVDGLGASGTNCLLLTCRNAAAQLNAGFSQLFASNTPASTQRFTLSFSYLPVQNTNPLNLIVRLTGGVSGVATGLVSLPVLPPPPPAPPPAPPAIAATYAKLTNTTATLDDLRAWHVYRAIHSQRQLHEVLAQFVQNHFATQYQKSQDYFDNNFNVGVYTNDLLRQNLAVDLHWREHQKFRAALLDPNCTFYDLLKISIESPAMIIYLDTILNSKAAPNQNYAREVLELHTFGADNGYLQQDIVDLARVWTGWRVDKKDASVANDPFAAPIPRTDRTNFANTPGLWVLHYSTNSHDTGTKRLFTNAPIDARFGGQFRGGQSYALVLTNTAAAGTNGFAEGYRVIGHLATLPYAMEFFSVKLCRLFVHEGFDYGRYDYTAANLTPEARLIRDCMTAWDTPAADGRKGNIRAVLNTIFASALFRGHGASQQKAKTPLELAVSAVRALRVSNLDTNGWVAATAESDGYGLTGRNNNTSPLSRMGGMGLFNKTEPDGFSEFGRVWLNTANLAERMRFVQHLLMPSTSSLKTSDYGTPGAANTADPVRLLRLRLPASDWNKDSAVVDFFLGLIYPGEGAGNLGRDRQAAMDYLNADEAGVPGAAPFSSLGGSAYDGRVRSMVGFLLSLPLFQEQ